MRGKHIEIGYEREESVKKGDCGVKGDMIAVRIWLEWKEVVTGPVDPLLVYSLTINQGLHGE